MKWRSVKEKVNIIESFLFHTPFIKNFSLEAFSEQEGEEGLDQEEDLDDLLGEGRHDGANLSGQSV